MILLLAMEDIERDDGARIKGTKNIATNKGGYLLRRIDGSNGSHRLCRPLAYQWTIEVKPNMIVVRKWIGWINHKIISGKDGFVGGTCRYCGRPHSTII
jgi:hypothetical protein